MAVGETQVYDEAVEFLMEDANGQWDSASDYAFILLDTTHTPDDADNDYQDVSGDECSDGDYAPIACGTRAVNRATGTSYLDSADADFGDPVTIAARYLVCLQGTFGSLQTTDKLMFYVDLTGSGNASSTTSAFQVQAPTNGWLSFAQA